MIKTPARRWPFTACVERFAVCITLGIGAASFAQGSYATDSNIEYATQLTHIYGSAAMTQPLGALTPGTAIRVSTPASASALAFTLDGWMQQGNKTSVFLAEGTRIRIAELTGAQPQYQQMRQVTDSYGNTWVQVRVSAYVKSSRLATDQDQVWKRAVNLYSTRCSACHALHKPDEFTANQWPGILKIMAKNAALQPAEIALVTQYLQTHAKP